MSATVVVRRILQDDTGGWLQWLLMMFVGFLALLGSVVLVYLLSVFCDKWAKWVSPSYPSFSRSTARENSRRWHGLDRDRLDMEDKKRIVKELFANETFLYSSSAVNGTASSSSKKEGETAEHGIQLQDLSTQGTSESDITTPKVQEMVEANSNRGSNRDLEKNIEDGPSEELFSATEQGCCICLAPYTEGDSVLRSKRCPHMFHSACCEDWILLKPVCPLCAEPMILDAEWEATAVAVLGQECYDAMLSEQRQEPTEATEQPVIVSSA